MSLKDLSSLTKSLKKREKSFCARARDEQKLTVLLTPATGAGDWGLRRGDSRAGVKHKAVLGDAMLPAELCSAVP